MTMASVRVLGQHLTDENHHDVLESAKGLTRAQIAELIAEIAPRPDVPSTMRKLPAPTAPQEATSSDDRGRAVRRSGGQCRRRLAPSTARRPAVPARSVVEPTAPDRYRIQFTIGRPRASSCAACKRSSGARSPTAIPRRSSIAR